jgi:flavodoxin
MNIRLVYATMTKHYKKLADAIAQDLNISAENVKISLKMENVDLMIIVGGIYGGESLPEMLAFVKSLDSNAVKKAVLITSCVTKKMGQKTVRQSLTENGIEVADEYICQGSFLIKALGHPNKNEIKEAVEFTGKYAK